MQLPDFLQKFEETFEEITPNSISGNTIYKELEHWNSMQAWIVIAMIDSDYGVTIDENDLKSSATASELFEIVKSKFS